MLALLYFKPLIILPLATSIIFGMLLLVVFGENGLSDLRALKARHHQVMVQKKRIFDENIALYRQIERLQNDPEFIESMARKELGVIGADELIFKLK